MAASRENGAHGVKTRQKASARKISRQRRAAPRKSKKSRLSCRCACCTGAATSRACIRKALYGLFAAARMLVTRWWWHQRLFFSGKERVV